MPACSIQSSAFPSSKSSLNSADGATGAVGAASAVDYKLRNKTPNSKTEKMSEQTNINERFMT
jgi:hypothetical protein